MTDTKKLRSCLRIVKGSNDPIMSLDGVESLMCQAADELDALRIAIQRSQAEAEALRQRCDRLLVAKAELDALWTEREALMRTNQVDALRAENAKLREELVHTNKSREHWRNQALADKPAPGGF